MGLRILHTADWHLGHSLHGLSRDYEHERFLDRRRRAPRLYREALEALEALEAAEARREQDQALIAMGHC